MDMVKAMAWFIIIVMIMSVLGVVGSSFFTGGAVVQETEVYNDHLLIKNGPYTTVNVNGQTYNFYNSPKDLEHFVFSKNPLEWVGQAKIYVAYDPSSKVDFSVQMDRVSALYGLYGTRTQRACIAEEGCPDIPLFGCNVPGILFHEGEESAIGMQKECIILSAKDAEAMDTLVERLIYQILGVMN